VHHLNVVAGAVFTYPVAAGVPSSTLAAMDWKIAFTCGHAAGIASRHDRWAEARAIFTTRDAGADEENAFIGQIFCAAVGIGKQRVTAVDDDISRFKVGHHLLVVWSTESPALTISMMRRGRLSRLANSTMEWAPTTFAPFASLAMKSSTLETVRLKTATLKPWSFHVEDKVLPHDSEAIRPISHDAFGIKIS